MKFLLILNVAGHWKDGPLEGDEAGLDLFPLTDDAETVSGLERESRVRFARVAVLDSAGAIHREEEALRDRIGPWAARLGERRIGARSVKEWFRLPGGTSAWWFSLLSEKSDLKTDAFFRVAQLSALDRVLSVGGYDRVFLSLEDGLFQKAVRRLCARHGFTGEGLVPAGRAGRRGRAKRVLARAGFLGDLVLGGFWLLRFASQAVRARQVMGRPAARERSGQGFLFVSVFPVLNEQKARQGIYENRFFAPLQEELGRQKKLIQWLLLWAPYEGSSFGQALHLARNLADKGEGLFFVQEFLSVGLFTACCLRWVVQAMKAFGLIALAGPHFLSEGLGVPEAEILLTPLWRQSFAGNVGAAGILYGGVFRQAFEFFRRSSVWCVYHAEMQAWEKALNAAKSAVAPEIKTVGFQHTAVHRGRSSHFFEPQEMVSAGGPAGLPMSDVFACNGAGPYSLFSRREMPGLERAEALRHFHLIPVLRSPVPPKPHPPILLIAGSIDRGETGTLLSLAFRAFPRPHRLVLRFKPHPAMPGDEILRDIGADAAAWPIETSREPVRRLLGEASLVLVGESSLSLEALAYGCRVLIPVRCGAPFANALDGREDLYDRFTGPEGLLSAVEKYMEGGPSAERVQRGRDFVASYWDLDDSLPRWKSLLGAA